MYSYKTMYLFNSIDNYGLLRASNASGTVEDEKTGDVVKIYLKVEDDTILEAKFKAFGSISTIILSSFGAKLCNNKTLAMVKTITPSQILEKVTEYPDIKTFGAEVVVKAIIAAVEDYEEKERKAKIKELKLAGLPIPDELKKKD